MSTASGSTDAAASGNNTTGENEDWRASVQQSVRSKQVREIASVLASLEPGATQDSKLMLAMTFEDKIFNSAKSLADYRKKLDKRLKKLQKNYVPTATGKKSNNDNEQRLLELRRKHGKALLFICTHANQAVAQMREKSGAERAQNLQQHIGNARQWTMELGLLNPDQTKLPKLDDATLSRLEEHLVRVENIRSHVVKLTQPDLFLQETLERLEVDFFDSKTSVTLSAALQRKFASLGWVEFNEPAKILKQSLEKALQPVPPPSRDPRSKINTALNHLETMRAASQSLLAFMATPQKENSDLPKHVLGKCHNVAIQCISYLQEAVPEKGTDSSEKLKLEHAWAKVMDSPSAAEDDDDEEAGVLDRRPSKRLKRTVLSCRVLLVGGRQCPSNVLAAFRRNQAKLVQPKKKSAYLILDFENVFTMTIYLEPLVVTITANNTTGKVSVWGADGDWELLGSIIHDRLHHASSQATLVLRKYFGSSTRVDATDFETEIAEASALIQFLHLARTTYQPNWVDKV